MRSQARANVVVVIYVVTNSPPFVIIFYFFFFFFGRKANETRVVDKYILDGCLLCYTQHTA